MDQSRVSACLRAAANDFGLCAASNAPSQVVHSAAQCRAHHLLLRPPPLCCPHTIRGHTNSAQHFPAPAVQVALSGQGTSLPVPFHSTAAHRHGSVPMLPTPKPACHYHLLAHSPRHVIPLPPAQQSGNAHATLLMSTYEPAPGGGCLTKQGPPEAAAATPPPTHTRGGYSSSKRRTTHTAACRSGPYWCRAVWGMRKASARDPSAMPCCI